MKNTSQTSVYQVRKILILYLLQFALKPTHFEANMAHPIFKHRDEHFLNIMSENYMGLQKYKKK
jgi:hypothetical protein